MITIVTKPAVIPIACTKDILTELCVALYTNINSRPEAIRINNKSV